MKRKMFSILISSTLLLQEMSFPVLANEDESKFEPMAEVETLTETSSDEDLTNDPTKNEYLDQGEYKGVSWTIHKDGTLAFGEGNLENVTSLASWPWLSSKYSDEITHIDGTASLSLTGNCGTMFYGLTNVKSINLSGWNTSEITDTSFMFSGCSSLTSIVFPSLDLTLSRVRSATGMFSNCTSLISLDLSSWDVSNLVFMSGMFSNCTSLTSINLSEWNPSNAKDMNSMFSNCTSLTSDGLSDISNWNTVKVSNTARMFKDCSSLVSLDLSMWNTSNIEELNGMFDGCSSLVSLDLSNWNISEATSQLEVGLKSDNLEEIKYNFNCENFILNLLSDLPQDWRWDQNGKGSYLVSEIPSLSEGESATLTRVKDQSTDLLVSGILGTATWTIDKNGVMTFTEGEYVNPKSDMNAFGREWYKYADQVKTVDGRASLKISGSLEGLFQYHFPNLESVNLSGWDISEVTSLERMFEECTLLKEVNLSGWNTSNVTNLQAMFLLCESLENLDLNHFNVSSVTDLSGMFEHCHSLKELNLSKWDVSKVEDMTYLFDRCYALRSLNLDGWKTSSLLKMGWMFRECNSLKSLDLSSWDISKVVTIDGVFYLNTGLEKLNISGWNTSSVVESDEERFQGKLFEGCENLYQIEYTRSCEDLLIQLSGNWYQNDNGPYAVIAIPPLKPSQNAVLTREDKYISKPGIEEPKEDDSKEPTPPVEDNKPTPPTEEDNNKPNPDDNRSESDGKEDPNLKDDATNTKPTVDSYTPTPTGDSSSVVVDLYIKNNQALEGIITENGKLSEEELKILETYLNTTPNYNPNDYSVTILNASVSKNTGNKKYNFELTVAITLKAESRINFILNKLEKKMKSKDAAVNESGLMVLSFEEAQTSPSYTVKEVKDKIIIEGLLVKDAFGSNNQIDDSFIKGILDDEGYNVSRLNFTSTQNKKSTFILHNLTSIISIELVSTETTTSPSSTRPSSNSSSTKPYYSIHKPNASSTVKKVLYRLFNTLTGEHFYTANESERNELLKDSRWSDEGQGWISPEISDFPIYRLVNPNNGDHHYTMDQNEYDTLAQYGWQQEGIGLYSADPNAEDIVQLHRLYNPEAKEAGSHHYTISEEERDNLIQQGWNYEGIAWYGLK